MSLVSLTIIISDLAILLIISDSVNRKKGTGEMDKCEPEQELDLLPDDGAVFQCTYFADLWRCPKEAVGGLKKHEVGTFNTSPARGRASVMRAVCETHAILVRDHLNKSIQGN